MERKSTSNCKKPRLSASRWQQFTEDTKPVLVEGIRMARINLGMCHKEVFTFISKCKNTKYMVLYDITDDTGDDSDIVQGVTSVFPQLVKLRNIDIRDAYLDGYGKSLLDNVNSPDLRVLILSDTHLGGNGGALTSCLSRLPLLSFLYFYNSGLSNVEFIQVLHVLPLSCSNLLFLGILGASFSNIELTPVFLLNNLRALTFVPSSPEDLIEALNNLPKTLQLLYPRGNVRISHILQEFISAIRSLPRLRFLVVNEGCLDSEGEQRMRDVLNKTEIRFVVQKTDPKGWKDYKAQVDILKKECFNAT